MNAQAEGLDEPAIMWFRRDLRVHDLPALADAAAHASVLPCFIFDDRLLTGGRFPSATRTSFMLGCLEDLKESLRRLGADLVIRRGLPEEVLPELAGESGARTVHWTRDVSPWAKWRDQRVGLALAAAGVTAVPHPGAYIVDDPGAIRSGKDQPYTVFTPFANAWRELERRPAEEVPETLNLASGAEPGEMPSLADLGFEADLPETSFEPGESAAREAARRFRNDGIAEYAKRRNSPVGGSSRFSPYIRWGCLSPLELESKLGQGKADGPRVFRSELAWREFYAAVIDNFPEVTRQEFQERYRGTLAWQEDEELFEAWKLGRTGYPLIDAGMRELLNDGWMHNRVRMVVASFLTKDLHLDWRQGERWFMERLVDGDVASNNGGWQWSGPTPSPTSSGCSTR